jgi:hypothetical protein
MRGKAKASLILALEGIRRKGCAAAGVRLAGQELSTVCRLELYGTWRLLTVFDAPDRCILLMVAEHTRAANPYQLLYDALGIGVPEEPRTKPPAATPKDDRPLSPTLLGASRMDSSGSLLPHGPAKRPTASVAERSRTMTEKDRPGHQQPMRKASQHRTGQPLALPQNARQHLTAGLSDLSSR